MGVESEAGGRGWVGRNAVTSPVLLQCQVRSLALGPRAVVVMI